jgi:hypothetical protein
MKTAKFTCKNRKEKCTTLSINKDLMNVLRAHDPVADNWYALSELPQKTILTFYVEGYLVSGYVNREGESIRIDSFPNALRRPTVGRSKTCKINTKATIVSR